MTPRKSKTSHLSHDKIRKSVLALSISSAIIAMAPIQAEEIELDTLQIEERANDVNPYTEDGAPYKARISGDSRRVKELVDTPQTITVITQEEILDSGNTDIKQILTDQPGITLGTGENGNAFGDRYIIRGHEARSDVYVDGLRDPGMTTRESFAVDQVEVTKGPSSTFAGRGSTGGAVNSVTKQASTEYDFNNASMRLGTDNDQRYTIDSNIVLADDLAIRINGLFSDADVPDRDPADRQREGLALSLTKAFSEATSLTADLYYLDAEDSPDAGTYTIRDGRPVSDIPVYLQDNDFLESEVMSGTLHLSHAFNDSVRIENAFRYGTTDNGYVVTGARGNDVTFGGAAAFSPTLSTHQGWQEVEYYVNQSNLFVDADFSGLRHQMIFGAEYSDLSVENGVYDINNTGTANCLSGGNPAYCATDENGNEVGNLDNLLGRTISKGNADADYSIKTLSLYAMDTIDLTDRFILSGGVRVDRFDYSNKVTSGGVTTNYSYDDILFNGHIGAVYKITEDLNVYANVGSAANINGGESDVGGSCGYGGLCADIATQDDLSSSEPERTLNVELGTKWNLFEDKLLFTASVFQITKDDVFEGAPRGTGYSDLGSINTGKNRVQGVELGLVGNLTEKLSMQLGLAVLDSEVLKSTTEADEGNRLGNFANNTGRAQLRYQLTPKFAFGSVATYKSEVSAGQPDSAASANYKLPSYTYYDLFASYDFTSKLKAKLNINNAFDKEYYTALYRSGAFSYIGDRRNANVTLSYKF